MTTTEGHPQPHTTHLQINQKTWSCTHKLQLQFKNPKPDQKDVAPIEVF